MLKNVKVPVKEVAQKDEAVLASVQKVTEELGDSGRILRLASGTEPLVRVMVEKCDKYVDKVIDVMKERLVE